MGIILDKDLPLLGRSKGVGYASLLPSVVSLLERSLKGIDEPLFPWESRILDVKGNPFIKGGRPKTIKFRRNNKFKATKEA